MKRNYLALMTTKSRELNLNYFLKWASQMAQTF